MPHPASPHLAVVLIVATLGLAGLGARPAAAADWTVQPAANHFGADREDYGYTVDPGGKVEDGVVLVNAGATPLRVALRATDDTTAGIGAWVRLDLDSATVPPGESVEVPFTLALPGDARPGDYAGRVVARAGGSDAGIPIRLRVGGALTPSLAVERLHVDYASTLNPLGKGDATVSYSIHNTGNAILSARQAVSVSGPFGRWAIDAGQIADSPALLPGATWKVSVPVRGVTPALMSKATVALVPLLTDAAGSTAPLSSVEASGRAWTVPWSLLVIVAVAVGVLVVARRAVRA